MSEVLRNPSGPTSTAEQGKLRWGRPSQVPVDLDGSRLLVPVPLQRFASPPPDNCLHRNWCFKGEGTLAATPQRSG